jgi:hypothetical protein
MPAKINENPEQQTKPAAKKSEKVTEILPTDRLSLTKQLEILRAYGALAETNGGVVTNAAVAKIVDKAETTVSLSNAFFNDVGLIQRTGAGYAPSSEVIAFCHAHEWDQEKAAHKLAPLLNRTWFAQALIPKLKFRALKYEEAVQALAEACFADKGYLLQLKMLVEYLVVTGIVVNDEGEIRLNRDGVQSQQEPVKPPKTEDNNLAAAIAAGQVPETFTTQEEHSLFLDKEKTKKFSISGPLFISRAEFNRICKWIEVTLIVEDVNEENKP